MPLHQILGFPCNQFGAQEPGTDSEILAFARAKGAKWPVFSKIDVNGDDAAPLYKYLRSVIGGGNIGPFPTPSDIKWNFGKVPRSLSTLSA